MGYLEPRLARAESGATVYLCASGHEHQWMSEAIACDLWLAPTEAALRQ